eukprot:CAMPEP_0206602202 /NCGR_PEP_ID=MMETSP0325_2-20121206/47218_1 /ASSEMBLY_ACC=CAM_ASM_000347 /TAXON_ID=2866 /ORGANISM="Crypthecodinium cohnii, Strain Seligo" /LENGTH=553 /DNA_ID=CAMNT_0054114587 /DNA_START=139 /DNA_END=1797 /DNA_ORIENTATION=+
MTRFTLKLAVFDFDQTLSSCHLFHTLAGGDGGIEVGPPFARTEAGQIAKLVELESDPQWEEQGGFNAAAFGGAQRVSELKMLLQELRASNVECVVCSRGLVGPIRRTLDKVGLLQCFTHIFANPSGPNTTEYDVAKTEEGIGEDATYLAGEGYSRWGQVKGKLIAKLMKEKSVVHDEVVFVDDTLQEIQGAQGLCWLINVQPPTGSARPVGMREREYTLLRRLLSGHPLPTTASGLSRHSPALKLAKGKGSEPSGSPGSESSFASPSTGSTSNHARAGAPPSRFGTGSSSNSTAAAAARAKSGALQLPRKPAHRPASEGAAPRTPASTRVTSSSGRLERPLSRPQPPPFKMSPPSRIPQGSTPTRAPAASPLRGTSQESSKKVAHSEGLPSPRGLSPSTSEQSPPQEEFTSAMYHSEEEDYLASPPQMSLGGLLDPGMEFGLSREMPLAPILSEDNRRLCWEMAVSISPPSPGDDHSVDDQGEEGERGVDIDSPGLVSNDAGSHAGSAIGVDEPENAAVPDQGFAPTVVIAETATPMVEPAMMGPGTDDPAPA